MIVAASLGLVAGLTVLGLGLGGIAILAIVRASRGRGRAESERDALEDAAKRSQAQSEVLAEPLPGREDMLDGPY